MLEPFFAVVEGRRHDEYAELVLGELALLREKVAPRVDLSIVDDRAAGGWVIGIEWPYVDDVAATRETLLEIVDGLRALVARCRVSMLIGIDGEEITGFGKRRDDPDPEPERQRSTEAIVDFVLRFVFGDG